MRNRSSLARALVRECGAYGVTADAIAKYGGYWNDTYALYVFPDGTAGGFTDLRHGACERDARGEPVLHFTTGPKR